ncbi:uncharacterized protein LOC131955102 [Physella acuta]|uniref:uncharacterized protein LOC131955102 n=1 Tax=Physella acuta TaxID=109671 RepID=UPI0027DD6974|nr:uncharacterized protein LOC131955102 [Physella acuta]
MENTSWTTLSYQNTTLSYETTTLSYETTTLSYETTTISVRTSLIESDYLVVVGVICLIRGVLSLLGCVGNVINLVTFVSMGLGDGVTVSFLFLSVSDLAYLVTVTASSVAFDFVIAESVESFAVSFPVDPFGVYAIFVNVGSALYTITLLTTTLLSVARCLSISRPLQFRHSFTRLRIIVTLSLASAASIATVVPLLTYMEIKTQFDSRINATRPSLAISPRRKQDYLYAFRDAILPLIAEFILIICVFVMRKCLQQSIKFRQTNSAGIEPENTSKNTTDKSNNDPHVKENRDKTKFSGKELQVIQQMILISSIFIVCNLPKILVNAVEIFLPGFTLGGMYRSFYLIFNIFRDLFQICISGTNVFIYFRYSSKFRKCCLITRLRNGSTDT